MKPKTELFLRKLPGRVWHAVEIMLFAVFIGVTVIYPICDIVANGWSGDGGMIVRVEGVIVLLGAVFAAVLILPLWLPENRDRIEELEEQLEKGGSEKGGSDA